jgi:hypothetical protein
MPLPISVAQKWPKTQVGKNNLVANEMRHEPKTQILFYFFF